MARAGGDGVRGDRAGATRSSALRRDPEPRGGPGLSRASGLGRALLLKALDGFAAVGAQRAFLEVTARNEPAVRMYRRLGFRSYKTIYREVEIRRCRRPRRLPPIPWGLGCDSRARTMPGAARARGRQGESVGQQVFQHTLPTDWCCSRSGWNTSARPRSTSWSRPGAAYDPPGQLGVASVLADLITRGAGDRDSRATHPRPRQPRRRPRRERRRDEHAVLGLDARPQRPRRARHLRRHPPAARTCRTTNSSRSRRWRSRTSRASKTRRSRR